ARHGPPYPASASGERQDRFAMPANERHHLVSGVARRGREEGLGAGLVAVPELAQALDRVLVGALGLGEAPEHVAVLAAPDPEVARGGHGGGRERVVDGPVVADTVGKDGALAPGGAVAVSLDENRSGGGKARIARPGLGAVRGRRSGGVGRRGCGHRPGRATLPSALRGGHGLLRPWARLGVLGGRGRVLGRLGGLGRRRGRTGVVLGGG